MWHCAQNVYIYVYYRALRNASLPPIPLPTSCLPVSMVNFHDPGVMTQDYRVYTFLTIPCGQGSSPGPLTVASVKLWHTVAGLYV